MSSDFFRVKKGLNIKPTDPAELSELEAGDLIVDSTDDNRLKVYDPTTSDFASVGTGGSSGNIMSDIEKLTPVVSNVVAVTDTVTFLPIDDNNKSVKATFSGSDGTIRYEAPASADLEGVQGVVKVWIKTSLNNLSVVATKDGVAQNNGVTINSTNKWRQYEIPVVLGDADYGFEVQASGAVAGDVFIDEGVVKVQRVVKELGQAQFVGKIDYRGDCNFDRTTAAWGYLLKSTDCTTATISGYVLQPDTKTRIGVKIPNFRTDGYYRIEYSGLLYNTTTTSFCEFTWSKTGSPETYPEAYLQNSFQFSEHNLMADVRFNAGDTGEMFILGHNGNDSHRCRAYGSSSNPSAVSVHFFPDANSTIVTQDTELTAKTANTLSFSMSDTGVVSNENYDFINGNCTRTNQSTYYRYDCPLNDIGITEKLTCVVSSNEGAGLFLASQEKSNSSTTNLQFVSQFSNGNTILAQSMDIVCSKSGADVNKSATIIGKFENINSSDLVKVRAKDLVGATSTTSFSYNYVNTITVLEDNYNALNDTGDIVFTAPKDSYYDFDFGARLDGATLNQIECGLTIVSSVTGASNPAITNDTNNAVASVVYPKCFFSNIKLAEGDTVTFYVRKSGTAAFTWNTDQRFSYLKITELPDTESIIKNLSQQKTLCQTKDLSADVTSDGTISSLSFSNLEIGKKYEIKIQARTSNNATVTDNVDIYADHDGSQILVLVQHHANAGGTSVTRNEISRYFTATSTTLTVGAASVGANMTITASGTNTRLCELPDTYVETTKFD